MTPPISRDLIRHPGPKRSDRILSARGTVTTRTVTLPRGSVLMQAVAQAMDDAGCDSGVMVLDGLRIGPYRYVMPGPSHDADHAAWYSAPRDGGSGKIVFGTAIVGRRDGAWWLHCHARWTDGDATRMGHLLPDDVKLSEDAQITLHAFKGGAFEVLHDAETNFSIFHAMGGMADGNAVIAKINPHEDISSALETLIHRAGFARANIHGIGSLIGAAFDGAPPMTSPISEVLIPPGAIWNGALHLPMECVDPDNGQYAGLLTKGHAPVCVTFEVMIVAT
tara:strand:+ start:854 stop:1690 length:837 start_codon:yes stop_codon:yes gene_type:complete